METTERIAEAVQHERMAAAFMAAHLLLQLSSGLLIGVMFLGMGGAISLIGYVEKEWPALAFGGLFGGMGLAVGLFLLVQAIPAAIAMWGLWRGSSWRTLAGIVAAGLALSHVPVGTFFGGGTLVFLFLAHDVTQKARRNGRSASGS